MIYQYYYMHLNSAFTNIELRIVLTPTDTLNRSKDTFFMDVAHAQLGDGTSCQLWKTTFNPVSFRLDLYEEIKWHHWQELLRNLYKTSLWLINLKHNRQNFRLNIYRQFPALVAFLCFKKHKNHCQYRLWRACTLHVSPCCLLWRQNGWNDIFTRESLFSSTINSSLESLEHSHS